MKYVPDGFSCRTGHDNFVRPIDTPFRPVSKTVSNHPDLSHPRAVSDCITTIRHQPTGL